MAKGAEDGVLQTALASLGKDDPADKAAGNSAAAGALGASDRSAAVSRLQSYNVTIGGMGMGSDGDGAANSTLARIPCKNLSIFW